MLRRLSLVAVAALVAIGSVRGQWVAAEESALEASTPRAGDLFGCSAAISGDTILIGAEGEDSYQGGQQPRPGRAYVFVRSGTGWTQQAKLKIGNSGKPGNDFGYSVAVSGDTAVVTAPRVLAAVFFVRNGTSWTQQSKLTVGASLWTRSVCLEGDTAIIGSPWEAAQKGRAYVYVRSGTTWGLWQTLTGDGGKDAFGYSVAMSGDTAVIGAIHEDTAGGNAAGAAYVFTRSGVIWSQQAKLTASDGSALDVFGFSVSVSGDRAAVGMPSDDHQAGGNAGAAYVFRRNGTSWTEEARLTASNAAAVDWFGEGIAIDGNRVLVGAPSHFTGSLSGAGYLFARKGTTWAEQAMLTANGGSLGESVAMEGHTTVLGARAEVNAAGVWAGAAHVFRMFRSPESYCTSGTSATGCSATIAGVGVPSATAASGFVLSAAGLEGARDGVFFFSTGGRQAAPWGNGTSYQCVMPPVRRAGLLAGTGNAGQCDGTFSQDLNARWSAVPNQNPGAGAIVQAQLWYRDPFNTSNQTTSLSDAIEFGVAP